MLKKYFRREAYSTYQLLTAANPPLDPAMTAGAINALINDICLEASYKALALPVGSKIALVFPFFVRRLTCTAEHTENDVIVIITKL